MEFKKFVERTSNHEALKVWIKKKKSYEVYKLFFSSYREPKPDNLIHWMLQGGALLLLGMCIISWDLIQHGCLNSI